MAGDGEHGQAHDRGVRNLPLLLAGLLTFGALGLPWLATGGGEPARADADIWEFTFALPGDPVDGEAAASGVDATGPGLRIHAGPRRLSIRPAAAPGALSAEMPGPAPRSAVPR